MRLADYIYPEMNIARSVNLERDNKNFDILNNYLVTPKTLEIIGRFINALQGERVSAWSLTGPYGMGKSALINFLTAITGPISEPKTNIALEKLKSANRGTYEKYIEVVNNMVGKAGFFRVSVTAAYEPVNSTLLRGLHNALLHSKLPGSDNLIIELEKIQEQKIVDSNKLIAVYQKASQLAKSPILVCIDEFGKNLDYLSQHQGKGDIFAVQQLAEMASVYLWVCLHQAFDEYAYILSMVQRREWSKVQGRFADIPFVESAPQMLSLIQKALKQHLNNILSERFKKWSIKAKSFIETTHLANKQLLNEKTIAKLYPLHPLTAVALIELCRRYAQYDRTLLSFLCSGDIYALPAYLERTELNDNVDLPAIGLDFLYDYFFKVNNSIYVNQAESQRWLEIYGIIENNSYLTALEQNILKNIGVLNLLSGNLGVKASKENISSIIEFSHGVNGKLLTKAINNLINKGVLLYREYAGEYRLWEGSDFDVYNAIRSAKDKLAISALDKILQDYLSLSPIIASRHGYQTGTVRRFERRWIDSENLDSELTPQNELDGLLLYCFGSEPEPVIKPEICNDGRPLLIAYTSSQSILHELALEVAASRAVLNGAPELVHDGAARKEVNYRLKVAEQKFRQHLSRLYSPGSDELQWYCKGERIEIYNRKDLSQKLSDLCDWCYVHCPHIGNEMINYHNLSSAAARARRELVEAMATKAGEENLGLTGYGPEMALYRSLLKARELHVKDEETDCWRFSLDRRDRCFNVLWNYMDEIINKAGDNGITVDYLINALQEPPFGMRKGPAPIYICVYILASSESIAVFQEGAYRPYIAAAEMALMIKRPELFVLKKFVSNQVEREVFDIYRNLLNRTDLQANPGLRNTTLLGVVGPLVKFIDQLPAYAKHTRDISPEAQRVRSAIENSSEPLRLLFGELPEALDVNINPKDEIEHKWQDELQNKLRSALQELGQAYPALNCRVQEAMLSVFGNKNIKELYAIQRKRALALFTICEEHELKSVLQAIARKYDDPVEWVKGIAGIVTKKPLTSWQDRDFTPFATKMRDYADRIDQLEALSSVNGNLVGENTRLISIMTPGGKFKREIVELDFQQDKDVIKKIDDIMSMPNGKRKAILAILAEKMNVSDGNGK